MRREAKRTQKLMKKKIESERVKLTEKIKKKLIIIVGVGVTIVDDDEEDDGDGGRGGDVLRTFSHALNVFTKIFKKKLMIRHHHHQQQQQQPKWQSSNDIESFINNDDTN